VFEPVLGMERLGTIKEIASRTGMAESHVHRALKGQSGVSSTTRQLVIAAVLSINAEKIERAGGFGTNTPRQS
jgi:DNA-binding LacI/PurR family transcriptional regulator